MDYCVSEESVLIYSYNGLLVIVAHVPAKMSDAMSDFQPAFVGFLRLLRVLLDLQNIQSFNFIYLYFPFCQLVRSSFQWLWYIWVP